MNEKIISFLLSNRSLLNFLMAIISGLVTWKIYSRIRQGFNSVDRRLLALSFFYTLERLWLVIIAIMIVLDRAKFQWTFGLWLILGLTIQIITIGIFYEVWRVLSGRRTRPVEQTSDKLQSDN